MNLYTIKKEYQEIIDRAENATAPDEVKQLENDFIINQEQFKEKSLAYTYTIRNIELNIESIKSEIKRLKLLAESQEALKEKLKTNIINAMVLFESEKLDLGVFKLSTRKSESANVDEAENYIKEHGLEKAKEDGYAFGGLYKITTEIKPSLTDIKELINSGCELKGCFVEKNKSLQIK